jgi:hypothetical protein
MTFDGLWTLYGHQKITLVPLKVKAFSRKWIKLDIREPAQVQPESNAQDLDPWDFCDFERESDIPVPKLGPGDTKVSSG